MTAKRLRREMTVGEARLWKALRRLDIEGTHFRRQVAIGRWIADFACHGARLVVEVDGATHDLPGRSERDDRRDADLTSLGYRVLRFSDIAVFNDLDEVVGCIAHAAGVASPTPNPSPQGGGEKKP